VAPTDARAAGVADPGRPTEILSWRHQMLKPAEYQRLAGQWEAFATAHPTDARALVEWGNALRYSGRREEANAKYRRAFEVDSLDAAAVEAYATSIISVHGEGTAWKEAHQMLVRSLAREPDYARTLYALWYSSLRAGDRALADRCLRGMVQSGDMPSPLLEYGANMIEGAPRNAILLTNGDNDTYPPLAYQLLTGRRPDATIVNLSLLNTTWYIRYLKGNGVPITLTDGEIDALKPVSTQRLVADQVVEHVSTNMGKGGDRSLWYAVTVPPDRRRLATGGCLGLLVPVTGGPVADAASQKGDTEQETPCDWARTRGLLDTVYRIEGAIDPLVDWKRESALTNLVRNYVALDCGVGGWLIFGGKKDEAGGYYLRAVRLLAFQQDRDRAQQVLDDWGAADPDAELLPEARRLLQP
jgi:tetratricopeptide (TPR) repeat protein